MATTTTTTALLMRGKNKIFNDPIHGHIEISSLAVHIMDTPQFQRLRDISQLGGTYYVFPGAASNRFEHCLGVSYLAKVFVSHLQENQPELCINEKEILCLEIAGLCHDLGHGPFSHLFDGKLLPLIHHNHDFVHEHASLGILDLLIEENNLYPLFQRYGLDYEDIHFIKELILGDPSDAPPGFLWKGRPGRSFLYDIVANKRNGIDVDKFDYFARDCHMLGLTKSFDSMRLMKFARVYPVAGRDQQKRSYRGDDLEVCFHVKEAWNLFELFHTRYALHKRAYQHRVCNAIDHMLVEALFLAEPYLFIPGKDNIPRTLSQCIYDYHAYAKLGEYLLKVIEFSTDEKLAPARTLIHRIRRRDLFACCGEMILSREMKVQLTSSSQVRDHPQGEDLEATIARQLLELVKEEQNNQEDHHCAKKCKHDDNVTQEDENSLRQPIDSNDIFVQIVHMGYGKGNSNPVSQKTTAFYEPIKSELVDMELAGNVVSSSSIVTDALGNRVKIGGVPEESVSRMLPREFEEVYVRVYARHKHQAALIKPIFLKWCRKYSIVAQTLTPIKSTQASTI
eukprot:gene10828-12038_t